MKNLYYCPHCQANLNPSVKVVLVARYRKRQGLILLSPLPGNFKFTLDRNVADVLATGAKVNFACPVCSADLTSPTHKDFIELHLAAPGQTARRVRFSRKYGTHATFIEAGDAVKAYGGDSEEFEPVNFFGA